MPTAQIRIRHFRGWKAGEGGKTGVGGLTLIVRKVFAGFTNHRDHLSYIRPCSRTIGRPRHGEARVKFDPLVHHGWEMMNRETMMSRGHGILIR